MPQFIQRSFAAGELSPEVGARADMTKYATGVELCRNFRVMKYGGLQYDPGSYFVTEVKNSSNKARLVEFIFNNDIAYVLEFGNLYMRVIRDGQYVLDGLAPLEVVTPYTAEQAQELNCAQSGDVMIIVHPSHPPQQLSRLDNDDWTLAAFSFGPKVAAPAEPVLTTSAQNPDPQNATTYVVTAIDDETGEESLPSPAPTPIEDADWTQGDAITVTITPVAGASSYNVYRSRTGSEFYFIGTAKQGSVTTALYDRDMLEDKNVQPPTGRNIFNDTGKYPSTVTFYQQRLVFAASADKPETVWMSRAGQFNNFTVSKPVQDDDSIEFTIAGRRFNRIRHIINIGRLVILTSEGEWLVAGDAAGAVTPTSINLQQEGYSGSAMLPPILVANTALYVQARGSIVRNLVYQFETDGYAGSDLTVFASHLFEKHTIVSWAYQQTPDSIIWCVRDDGKLLGLTYMPEHDVWGWHQHDTDGYYENVCVVPEGNIDVLYVTVRRFINGSWVRYIEVIRDCKKDIRDCFHVHSGLTYDGRSNNGELTVAPSFSEQGKWDFIYNGSLQQSNVGDEFVIYSNPEIRLRIDEVVNSSSGVASASMDIPSELLGVTITNFGFAVNQFAGLGHLEGKVVSVVADGMVLFNGDPDDERASEFTVNGGEITLSWPASVVHIGLPYKGQIETLRLENVQGQTIVNLKKLVNRVAIMYESSRGLWVGTDFEHLTEMRQREVDDEYDPQRTKTELNEVAISSRWERNAKVCIEQKDPLPLHVIAISPTGFIGGS